jgi:ADP-heptose:LPS heptosyltransferase
MAGRVLTVRADAIGDAILWGGALERLRTRFPGARHAVLCRESVAPLYEHCPFVDDILAVAYDDARFSAEDRERAVAVANGWNPDLLLDPVRSKAPNALSIVAEIRADRRVALEPDSANHTPGSTSRDLSCFDEVIPGVDAHDGCASELDQHLALLRGLGDAGTEPVAPRVWLTEGDRRAARDLLRAHDADHATAIAVTPRGRWRYKAYPHWAEALAIAFERIGSPPTLVVLGSSGASEDAEAIRRGMPCETRVINLVDRTPIRVAMALIGMTRACIGTDTFAIHAACTQGVPNAALLGGGHPGRFLPYSPLTRVAMLPLDCYGCDWRCVHDRAHCVADIPPATVAEAIVDTLDRSASDHPRVFTPREPLPHTGRAVGVTLERAGPALGGLLAGAHEPRVPGPIHP